MVNIAIAGGSSNVGAQIIDALQQSDKHSILLLSRKEPPRNEPRPGITWAKADYHSKDQLIQVLRGQHTVLSFIDPQSDENNVAQKNLIDASIEVGVKRFAPSEWSYQDIEHFPWYAGKGQIRAYLKEVNKNGKVLSYSLFAPGLFTNYFTYPHLSSKHFETFELWIDFNKRRALVEEGGENGMLTLTTASDFGEMVARAVEFEGEWPVDGGIQGSNVTVKELIEIGERVRGGKFSIEYLKKADLKEGNVQSSWLPKDGHHSVPADVWEKLAPMFVSSSVQAASADGFAVSDEWNRLLPGYRFTDAETFLREAWEGKP